MENIKNAPEPGLVQAEPVLAVRDVVKTLQYWHDVLNFPDTWKWGDPVVYGGAAWHGVQVQFTQDPVKAAVSTGNSVWFKVRNIAQLYALHQTRGAEITSPLALQPWGMGQYTVRDLNGYLIHFAAPWRVDTDPGETLPDAVRIMLRPPTLAELNDLITAVGWSVTHTTGTYAVLIDNLVAGVVAENSITQEAIGCALLTGNAGSMYYVRDVVVKPNWQGKHIGSALMQALICRADILLPANSMVTLITSEDIAPFYRQFDFTPAFSMIRHTRTNPVTR